jgi:hypothetical protein
MQNTKFQKIFLTVYSASDDNIEECIASLKDSGASQMDCVKILIWGLKVSLSEADKRVLQSKAWEENKKFTDFFRDDFANQLETE